MNLQDFACACSDLIWGGDLGWDRKNGLELLYQAIRKLVLQWQPIGTAPKNGTEILGWRKDAGIMLIKYDAPVNFLPEQDLEKLGEESAEAEDWFCAGFITGERLEGQEVPTHWMPLGTLEVRAALEGGE